MGSSRKKSSVALAAFVALSLLLPQPVLADDSTEVIGYSTPTSPIPADEDWIDPAELLGLDLDDLEPALLFQSGEFHDSTVFASGVDWVLVEADQRDQLVERHIRVLQVVATLERDLATTTAHIDGLRPTVETLLAAIEHERSEEARLTNEIVTLKSAIAEFAVRAFIADDELDTALTTPDSSTSETRVVSDEVRDDQFIQITKRETERTERQYRRAAHESMLRETRTELRALRRDRITVLHQIRDTNELAGKTAATYQHTVHQQLSSFVEGTDVPLVALNAYVIAERLQAIENPSCGIEWWMLAGIGKIESLHGHFANSKLDVNGDTTEPITGPALDGRILEGEEFLVEGVELPEATDRTGTIEVELPPPSNDDADAGETGIVAAASPSTLESAPAPVIKRLALISDTDNGRLDGDRTYDRAVGPMQFIPQTWLGHATDTNQDGDANPQNIYDAALASARYLCAAAGSMTTSEGQQRAYFAYNHDQEYSDDVSVAADFYHTRIDIPADVDGTAHELGIANPVFGGVANRAAEAAKALDDPALPDW